MSIRTLIEAVSNLISQSIAILVGVAVLVFFWGLAKFMLHAGSKDKVEEGKNFMIWGVIALFVVVSVWGIIGFFQRSFGLNEPPSDTIDAPIPSPPDDPFDPQDRNA